MVKALDLRSNVRMHTWVRTPLLVVGPCNSFSYFFLLFLSRAWRIISYFPEAIFLGFLLLKIICSHTT